MSIHIANLGLDIQGASMMEGAPMRYAMEGAASSVAMLNRAFSCADHNVSYDHRVDNPGGDLVLERLCCL